MFEALGFLLSIPLPLLGSPAAFPYPLVLLPIYALIVRAVFRENGPDGKYFLPIILASYTTVAIAGVDDAVILLLPLFSLQATFHYRRPHLNYSLTFVFFLFCVLSVIFQLGFIAASEEVTYSKEYRRLLIAQYDTVTLYANGLGSTAAQASRLMPYDAAELGVATEIQPDDRVLLLIYDVSLSIYSFFRTPLIGHKVISIGSAPWPMLDIGGEVDALHFATIAATLIRRSEKPVVLFGLGRGAATVFNALALLQQADDWNTVIRPRIRFVVCVNIFTTVEDVLWYHGSGGVESPIHSAITWLLSREWLGFAWRREEPFAPLETVPRIPGGVRIAFIASMEDRVVPVLGTMFLVEAIKAENEKREEADMIRLVDPLYLQKSSHHLTSAPVSEVKAMMDYMIALYEGK